MFGILDYLKLGAGVAAGLMVYHLYAVVVGYPSAAREARAGYVVLAEKTAAEAKAAEMERQMNAAQGALASFQKNLDAARQSEQQAKDTLENELSAFQLQLSEKNRQCLADSADLDFIRRH
jgi:uncharacterized membrane protein